MYINVIKKYIYYTFFTNQRSHTMEPKWLTDSFSALPVVKVTWSTRREICWKILIYLKLIPYYHKYHSHILIVSKNTYSCIYSPASFSKRIFLIRCIFQNWVHIYLFSNCYLFLCESWGKNIFFCPVKYLS